MREIKFRAWHKEQKRMFDVYGLGKDWCTEDTLDGVDQGTNAFDKDDMHLIQVMQYTGLKDKNGKDIYEGDIVLLTDTNQCDLEIYFKNGAFWGKGVFQDCIMDRYLNSYDFQHLIVIGNIHQNPELLNEK